MKVLSGILYSLRRHKLGAFSLLHWLSIICLGLAALIATAQFEIHRFWSSPFLLLSVAIPVLDGLAARGNYVSFTPVHQDLEVTRLSPQTQLSVRATGLFEVEGRFRRHTWLEASYRTFPSENMPLSRFVSPVHFCGWPTAPSLTMVCGTSFVSPARLERFKSGTCSSGNC